MLDKHREIHFEAEIVAHLATHGWLEGEAAKYDRELALYPEDLIGWLQDTQPEELAKLTDWHGKDAERALCRRVAALLDERGTLSLLRHGFKDICANLSALIICY